jgi:superfamily II DNA or RNA helicase
MSDLSGLSAPVRPSPHGQPADLSALPKGSGQADRCARGGDQSAPILRSYQLEAADRVASEFSSGVQRTMVEMATGTGKSAVIGEVVRRETDRGGRALVLAPRVEIVDQLARALKARGLRVAVEQGDRKAPFDVDAVVATVATLRGPRLARWKPEHFTLVVADECHHSPAKSWAAVFSHFPAAKALGCTATGDRADGQGLGRVFESVAFRYPIRVAIRDGYLARIVARRVSVSGLDLGKVHVRAGDLDARELAAIMSEESKLHAVAAPLLELAGDRPTIVFAVDVAHAKALAEMLNRYRPNIARSVDGNMSATERAAILGDFAAGRFRMLVNVALLTEGYDCPPVSCIAMARPTKSRALYTQCVGRGTRLHKGKADCLVVDLVGNAGRHRLIGPADVLADREVPDDVRDLIEAALAASEADVDELLDSAAEQAEAKRRQAAITAVARYRAEEIDPFVGDGDMPEAPNTRWAADLATEAQRHALEKAGLDELPVALTKGTASQWLDAIARRRNAGLATLKQVRLLRRHGVDARRMTLAAAGQHIERLKQTWRQLREAA